ncbi:hypothetical protein QT971_30505, partial [Microcoleus sp. herbarium19]
NEITVFLFPPKASGGRRGGQRVLHDFREMVLFNKPQRAQRKRKYFDSYISSIMAQKRRV